MIRTKQPEQTQPAVSLPKAISPSTRARAIKLKCYQCMGYTGRNEDGSTGYKEASKLVRECDTHDCPIWFFRGRAKDNIMHGKATLIKEWLKKFTGGK